ncbi:MAG: hypothetical protein HGA66_09845 [Holophaga sp.]|nr:hypothetical protein [Holophaga sp.]
MPRVVFTANLQRHVPCPPCVVAGATVREALDNAFAREPRVRATWWTSTGNCATTWWWPRPRDFL